MPAFGIDYLSKRHIESAVVLALVLVLASLAGFAQEPVPAKLDFIPTVSFSDVLTGLGDQSIKSYFDRNRELIKIIDDRGVSFALRANTKDVLIKAGASELLLNAISRKQEGRFDEIIRLAKMFRDNYPGRDIETRQKVVTAGREFLDKIGDPDLLVGDEKEWRIFIDYLKDTLPKMEERLHKQQQVKTPPEH